VQSAMRAEEPVKCHSREQRRRLRPDRT
jgi:hypothetical protein